MRSTPLFLSAILFLSSASFAAESPTAPLAGTYGASVYITDANGDDCVDQMGQSFAGVMTFGGLNGTKHIIRVPVLTFGSPAIIMSLQALTVTSGAGTTKPKGTFVWTGNAVTGKQFKYTGVFSAKITELSSDDFLVDLTEQYKHCTEYDEIGLVRASTLQ